MAAISSSCCPHSNWWLYSPASNYNSPRMDQPFDILQWRVLAAVQ
jgi:hypothetical protein